MVFQEAADHGTHTNAIRYAGNAGSQRTHAAHDQIDFHTGL